ncbi:hypothetical protein SAMN05445756_1534 [Kytococcus aerolatus]|uniref:4Fe-4S Wbl-type domain-containing protein n=1 Tax=Kytococcus aerolatus TaxID=592308 RepID=A0A212TZZ7_9MICO|nr:hypothetical protein [Kytococcus aerolatus]SNC71549.1 hypothetical protein SAMN05445756_1534 [Kytococcus aerolatus]
MSPAEAHAALAVALARAAARGEHVPCRGRDGLLWVSDSAEDRALAAELCTGCPALVECDAVGQHETWNVWAGVDREAAAAARRAARRKE